MVVSEVVLPERPRLRGVLHQYAFVVALVLGLTVLIQADGARAITSAAIYGAGICGLFGVSAAYHRGRWSPRAMRWWRRADHSMIFCFIAASYTPVALLVLRGTLGITVLCVVWGGALAGAVFKLAWLDHPDWLAALLYVLLGWVAVIALPSLVDALGVPQTLLLGLGGVLYTAGAVVYARQRPDPVPTVFGYHEVFHVLVVLAAAAHFAVLARVIV